MPPQFQSQFVPNNNPSNNTPVPENNSVPQKSPRGHAFLIIVMILLILTGVFGVWYFSNPLPDEETGTETITNKFADWKTYTNTQYGFEIKYSPDFVFEENSDGAALVAFYVPNGSIEGSGTKIYLKHSNFQTFDDFVKDMKQNSSFKAFKANNKSVPDDQVRAEANKFDAQYPFEIMKINNADVLKHTSPFAFGLVDTGIYIWIGKGDYLSIYTDNNLDLNSFKFISTSTPLSTGTSTNN
jgi:hypothetical protein